MIQANELRIDNVFYFAGGVATISGIFDLTQVWVAFEKKELKINLKKLNPIPLTPEILEKVGFKREEDGILNVFSKKYLCTCPIQDSKPDHIDFKIYEDNYGNWYLYFEGAGIGNGFKYLHQLQNIYFALTGQELTINLHATA